MWVRIPPPAPVEDARREGPFRAVVRRPSPDTSATTDAVKLSRFRRRLIDWSPSGHFTSASPLAPPRGRAADGPRQARHHRRSRATPYLRLPGDRSRDSREIPRAVPDLTRSGTGTRRRRHQPPNLVRSRPNPVSWVGPCPGSTACPFFRCRSGTDRCSARWHDESPGSMAGRSNGHRYGSRGGNGQARPAGVPAVSQAVTTGR